MTENKRAVTVSTCSWSRCLQPQVQPKWHFFEDSPADSPDEMRDKPLAWHRKPRRTGGMRGMAPTLSRRGVRRTTWMAFAWTLLTGDTLYRSQVDDVDVDLRDGWLRCVCQELHVLKGTLEGSKNKSLFFLEDSSQDHQFQVCFFCPCLDRPTCKDLVDLLCGKCSED